MTVVKQYSPIKIFLYLRVINSGYRSSVNDTIEGDRTPNDTITMPQTYLWL